MKQIIFEFDFKSKFKSEIYKLIILTRTNKGMYYSRGFATLKTSLFNLIIFLVILGIFFIIIILIIIIILSYKKSRIRNMGLIMINNIIPLKPKKNDND